MLRFVKVLTLFLLVLFSIPAFTEEAQQQGNEPKWEEFSWDCDPKYKDVDGEIVVIAEEHLKADPKHRAICLFMSHQNSILWKTKDYDKINVILIARDKSLPNPFELPIQPNPINPKLISSGKLKPGKPGTVFHYKVFIELTKDGKVTVIDPHNAVHPGN